MTAVAGGGKLLVKCRWAVAFQLDANITLSNDNDDVSVWRHYSIIWLTPATSPAAEGATCLTLLSSLSPETATNRHLKKPFRPRADTSGPRTMFLLLDWTPTDRSDTWSSVISQLAVYILCNAIGSVLLRIDHCHADTRAIVISYTCWPSNVLRVNCSLEWSNGRVPYAAQSLLGVMQATTIPVCLDQLSLLYSGRRKLLIAYLQRGLQCQLLRLFMWLTGQWYVCSQHRGAIAH